MAKKAGTGLAGNSTTRGPMGSVRFGMASDEIQQAFSDNMLCLQGRVVHRLRSPHDIFMALAYTVRDRLLERVDSEAGMVETDGRKGVIYLSAEFLLGPQLGANLINMGMFDSIRRFVMERGSKMDDLLGLEPEPGLGNGGLGRLAACFLDSLASLGIPTVGYGIRYEFGIFSQTIQDGWQVEKTDKWLQSGNPWEIARPELSCRVSLGGHTEGYKDSAGRYGVRWVPHRQVVGVPYDTWIPGYGINHCSLLRLWKSEATESFDLQAFNHGDYYRAVEDKVFSENISKILYPNDEQFSGKQLRLEQQYFFVSCSLQDMLRFHLSVGRPIHKLHDYWGIQINDTHPSIGIAELMRLLIDEHDMGWDEAWDITHRCFAYTNHTLLPEALEKWPLPLFRDLLPRHMEIIYEINARFLNDVRAACPGDEARIARMSIIDENGEKFVRMAHLACVGSHRVNGVAQLHSELLKNELLRDFSEFAPGKFLNVTNGVTHRRWMLLANPDMSKLITETIGEGWISDMDLLRDLEPYADDPGFRDAWVRVKRAGKSRLAGLLKKATGDTVDPDSLFDVQVKRIHEYKRQHLNVLHVISLYNRIKASPSTPIEPRTVIFGGKAAPGYFMAKLIIKLIHSVAEVVNSDPETRDRLRVSFFPDFNVGNGQTIYPAADLSEQISTAGMEASGTGNMKFAMGGALTIGTLDGANVEIRQEVGAENFFLFGHTVQEVEEIKRRGYRPADHYHSNDELRQAIDSLSSGYFSRGDRNLFRPLVDSLLNSDPFLLLADYASYVATQAKVEASFLDQAKWTRMSILNVARSGKFSSDRAIREYCERVWDIPRPE